MSTTEALEQVRQSTRRIGRIYAEIYQARGYILASESAAIAALLDDAQDWPIACEVYRAVGELLQPQDYAACEQAFGKPPL